MTAPSNVLGSHPRVEAFMGMCYRPEASLTATAAARRRMLDALLAEALAPVDVAELEAAE